MSRLPAAEAKVSVLIRTHTPCLNCRTTGDMLPEPMLLYSQEFALQAPGPEHSHIKYFVGKFSGVSFHRPYLGHWALLCMLLGCT